MFQNYVSMMNSTPFKEMIDEKWVKFVRGPYFLWCLEYFLFLIVLTVEISLRPSVWQDPLIPSTAVGILDLFITIHYSVSIFFECYDFYRLRWAYFSSAGIFFTALTITSNVGFWSAFILRFMQARFIDARVSFLPFQHYSYRLAQSTPFIALGRTWSRDCSHMCLVLLPAPHSVSTCGYWILRGHDHRSNCLRPLPLPGALHHHHNGLLLRFAPPHFLAPIQNIYIHDPFSRFPKPFISSFREVQRLGLLGCWGPCTPCSL